MLNRLIKRINSDFYNFNDILILLNIKYKGGYVK